MEIDAILAFIFISSAVLVLLALFGLFGGLAYRKPILIFGSGILIALTGLLVRAFLVGQTSSNPLLLGIGISASAFEILFASVGASLIAAAFFRQIQIHHEGEIRDKEQSFRWAEGEMAALRNLSQSSDMDPKSLKVVNTALAETSMKLSRLGRELKELKMENE